MKWYEYILVVVALGAVLTIANLTGMVMALAVGIEKEWGMALVNTLLVMCFVLGFISGSKEKKVKA